MFKGSWKIGENDEATYIDIEDEESEEDDAGKNSYWPLLPDLVIERVFSHLTMRQRYYASMVCRNWYRAFKLPYVWSTFIFGDSTLTRRKYNYYYGWQHVLDHLRTQNCLVNVGRNIRILIFEPMLNFFNLYEFMNMMSFFAERLPPQNLEIGQRIRALKYTFPCNMTVNEEQEEQIRIFGTGGKLLQALKRLMGNLPSLKRLELIDLMLEPRDAQHLLDEVCNVCCLTLQTLILVNTTKLPCQILHAGVFLNLQVLVISPQNLGEDLLELLGHTTLCHLHILQNKYSPGIFDINPISPKVWRQCRRNNPELRVHLKLEGMKEGEMVWQSAAPVTSILYDSPHIKIRPESMLTAVDLYNSGLRIYGHQGLPDYCMAKSFHERVDSLLLLLCRQCPNLQTLLVRERVSSATLLLIADTAKNLRYFLVRKSAILLSCDWPESPEWSPEYYEWLLTCSNTYEAVEREVGLMLKRNWKLLSDQQYQMLQIDPHYDEP